MTTEARARSNANLKRGGGWTHEQRVKGGRASQDAQAARKAGSVIPEDDEPRIVQLRRVHRKLLTALEQQLDRLRRNGQPIDRETIEVSKEVRQTGATLYDLIQTEGSAAARDEWLADLEAATRKAAPKLEKALGLEPLALPEQGGVLAASDV